MFDKADLAKNDKIALRDKKGIQIVALRDIVYCRASGRYTYISLLNTRIFLVTELLIKFEKNLPPETFYRISRSYLINVNYVLDYDEKNQLCCIDCLNISFKVSRRKKIKFRKFLISHFLGLH